MNVKYQLKDPTKMFETCWLLGCPTTQKPGLKDYDLSKARTELCIQASRQALMRLFGTAQRIGPEDSSLTEDMYSSIESEELEELIKAGMNNGPDKEEANQQDTKDEDENQINDTSEEMRGKMLTV